jgi:hypothetical protein
MNLLLSVDVAVTVTGFASAAVQVAVVEPLWVTERWTEGSLTVQLEFTRTAVAEPHTPENLGLALKIWPLPGGAAA